MESSRTLQRGWRRVALVTLGLALVGMGYLGVLLPGLPTTPFLLGASFCFYRSSPRLHRWLRRSPVLGRVLHDWEVHRGIRKPVKVFAICMVTVVVTCSIVLSPLPWGAKIAIGCLALFGITVILSVPTVGRQPAVALDAGQQAKIPDGPLRSGRDGINHDSKTALPGGE